MNDVKAHLEVIARVLGKSLAKVLHKLGEAATATIGVEKVEKDVNLSAPQHLDSRTFKPGGTGLSPLHWLLVAASCSGAAAALVIVFGFKILDSTSASIAPLKDRIAVLDGRLDSINGAEATIADRVAAAESTIAKSTTVTNSTLAELQKIQRTLAAQHLPSPGETATVHLDFARLEKRVAALENSQLAAGSPEAESKPTSSLSPSGESGQGEATFPPFDTANFTPMLIWLTLSFGVLYLLMSKIALPRVESILHARSHKISTDISEANGLRTRAEEAAAAHEKTIAEAKAKAVALAKETHAKLNAETEAKHHALETELNAKLAASETQVLAMKAKAMDNVEAIAKETAAAIVQHITGKPADQDAIAKAVATIKA